MHWADIIGNRRVVDYLKRSCESGFFTGGVYVFSGVSGLGKTTVARLCAAALIGTSYQKVSAHPDVICVERLIDEKQERKKRDITVEQARDLKQKLATSSWAGGVRCVVVEDADTLNEEAGNALLKIMEEPRAKTVFFLIVHHEERLLSTIRSRAQHVRFSVVPHAEMIDSLGVRFSPEHLRITDPRRWFGRPGRAIRLIEHLSERERDEMHRRSWHQMVHEPWYRQSRIIEEWVGKGEQSGYDRDEVDAMLESWLLEVHGQFEGHALDDPRERSRVFYRVEALQEARRLMARNVQPRLVLEQCARRVRG